MVLIRIFSSTHWPLVFFFENMKWNNDYLIEQLADQFPLSRINVEKPGRSLGLNKVFWAFSSSSSPYRHIWISYSIFICIGWSCWKVGIKWKKCNHTKGFPIYPLSLRKTIPSNFSIFASRHGSPLLYHLYFRCFCLLSHLNTIHLDTTKISQLYLAVIIFAVLIAMSLLSYHQERNAFKVRISFHSYRWQVQRFLNDPLYPIESSMLILVENDLVLDSIR